MTATSRISKPAPPHNPMFTGAPAMCGCVECSRLIVALRCPVVRGGQQCGDYKGHRGYHSLLVATALLIADERVRLDGPR